MTIQNPFGFEAELVEMQLDRGEAVFKGDRYLVTVSTAHNSQGRLKEITQRVKKGKLVITFSESEE